MNFTITKEDSESSGLTNEEATFLMCFYMNPDFEEVKDSLINKGFIKTNTLEIDFKLPITDKGYRFITKIQIDETLSENEFLIKKLALELKEIYPKGKKGGVYYWTDGVNLIERRIKGFLRKYDKLATYEEIVEATKKYVEAFKGDDKYMKLLKYFMYKEEIVDGVVEGNSDLYNIICGIREGETDFSAYSSNWTDELI